ncbi:hypothetical protein FRC03_009100 [Tulasnella sp. 419]|nr:hypothetical protein FRC02_007758 [Tulasnella sp. 418]KAG8958481.1 hypothetical protein FRC03_009100 [Tulasnella sp. 419]
MRSPSLLCLLVVSNGLLCCATPVNSGLNLQRRNGCESRREVEIKANTYRNLKLLSESEEFCVYTNDNVVARLTRRAGAKDAQDSHVKGLEKSKTLQDYGEDIRGYVWSIQTLPFSGGALPYKHNEAAKAFKHVDKYWKGEFLNPVYQMSPLLKPHESEDKAFKDCVEFVGMVRGLISDANKELEQKGIYLLDTDIDDWLINGDMTKAVNIYLGDWDDTPRQNVKGMDKLRVKWNPTDHVKPYPGVCESDIALHDMKIQKWHDLVNTAQGHWKTKGF